MTICPSAQRNAAWEGGKRKGLTLDYAPECTLLGRSQRHANWHRRKEGWAQVPCTILEKFVPLKTQSASVERDVAAQIEVSSIRGTWSFFSHIGIKGALRLELRTT